MALTKIILQKFNVETSDNPDLKMKTIAL